MTNEQGTFTLSTHVKTRNYMVHFGCRNTRNCITQQNNIVKLLQFWIDNKAIFQMACILCPECNFLHSYLKCVLPAEIADMELKIKMMQGIHTFRQDRTYQIIKCNPWSTRLCPYPSLVRKMKTYLELKGRLGPKPKPQSQTPVNTKLSTTNSITTSPT